MSVRPSVMMRKRVCRRPARPRSLSGQELGDQGLAPLHRRPVLEDGQSLLPRLGQHPIDLRSHHPGQGMGRRVGRGRTGSVASGQEAVSAGGGMNEQGVGGIAEALCGARLQLVKGGHLLLPQPLRPLSAGEEGPAGVGALLRPNLASTVQGMDPAPARHRVQGPSQARNECTPEA